LDAAVALNDASLTVIEGMRISRVAVVVSRRFQQIDGAWYTFGSTIAEGGERYLDYFDEVIICGRVENSDNLNLGGLTRLDPRVRIVALPDVTRNKLAYFRTFRDVRNILCGVLINVDAVIVRLGSYADLATRVAAELGKPIACDVGGRQFDGLKAHVSLGARLYAQLAERNARRAVSRCSHVSYVTQSYLQRHYPPPPGAQVFSGSNVDVPAPAPEVLRHRLDRIGTRDLLTFGTLGSLVGRLKGIHVALQALSEVSDKLPAWHYRVLGGGDPAPLMQLAERLGIGERVSFDGARPSGQPVLDWLDEIDVLVHPSLREGVPRAVIEAMTRGCPAIATNVGGTSELLPEEDLIPAGNAKALGQALLRSTSPDWQRASAERNWTKSRDYASEVLGPARAEFWRGFAEYASRTPVGRSIPK